MAPKIIAVQTPQELDSALLGTPPPVHVLLCDPNEDLADYVWASANPERMYSIWIVGSEVVARHLAERLDDTPVFLCDSAATVQSGVGRLIESPHTAVNSALNGEAVSIKYLSGHSS